MATSVTAIENVGDGLNLDLTLNAAAAGALVFKCARVPGLASGSLTTVTGVHQGSNVYRVAVRSAATSVRLCYYVSVWDGATRLTSFQIKADGSIASETAWWICTDDERGLMQLAGDDLQEILTDNLQALDAALHRYLGNANFPSGKRAAVRKIHKGLPVLESGDYPRIAIMSDNRNDDPYFANPRTDLVTIKSTIICYHAHQSNVSWDDFVRALGDAVFDVLNQTHYVERNLANGIGMTECYALDMSVEEFWDEGAGVWVATSTINHQSKAFLGREV